MTCSHIHRGIPRITLSIRYLGGPHSLMDWRYAWRYDILHDWMVLIEPLCEKDFRENRRTIRIDREARSSYPLQALSLDSRYQVHTLRSTYRIDLYWQASYQRQAILSLFDNPIDSHTVRDWRRRLPSRIYQYHSCEVFWMRTLENPQFLDLQHRCSHCDHFLYEVPIEENP